MLTSLEKFDQHIQDDDAIQLSLTVASDILR